jgi:hypothetical protein
MIRTIVVVAAVLAVLGDAGAAQAQPKPAQPKSTHLQLTYMAEAGYAAAVKLGCDPAFGPHPEAVQACAVLHRVDGRPDKIKPADTMCMMLYAPVTAEMTGTWEGHKIDWKHTYGNKCMLNRATGVLFTF